MPFDFVLPDLGEGTTEGEIRKWLVKEGDAVEEHQTALEIETDKAVVEVPSPKKGTVLRIHREVGDIVKVGEALLTIALEGESAPKEEQPKTEQRPASVSVVGVLPDEEEEILATPAVRALAKDIGVPLESLKGTGPGGSITKEDVMKASPREKKAEDPYGPVERMPLRGLRRTIAKNLIISQKTTAFVTGMEEADVTDLWVLREKEKKGLQERGVHLTFLPFLIKAVYHALVDHPMLNASVDDEREEIERKE